MHSILLPNLLIVCMAKTFNFVLFVAQSSSNNSNKVWQTEDASFCLLRHPSKEFAGMGVRFIYFLFYLFF